MVVCSMVSMGSTGRRRNTVRRLCVRHVLSRASERNDFAMSQRARDGYTRPAGTSGVA